MSFLKTFWRKFFSDIDTGRNSLDLLAERISTMGIEFKTPPTPTDDDIRLCAYYAAEKDSFRKSPEEYWIWAESYLLWHDAVVAVSSHK
jgi:hypothetical protein